MSAIFAVDDARSRGWPVVRERVFPIILDIPKKCFDELEVGARFWRVFNALRVSSPFPLPDFLLDDHSLAKWEAACVARGGSVKGPREKDTWPAFHESMFSANKVKWPPGVRIETIRERECECVAFAVSLFPMRPDVDVDFIDVQHDASRLFRWPPKPNKEGHVPGPRIPWVEQLPTFTGRSRILARRHATAEPSRRATVLHGYELRRLHALEQFR